MAVKGPNTVKSIVAGLHGTHDPARQSKQGAIQSMVTGHNVRTRAYTCVHVRTRAYTCVHVRTRAYTCVHVRTRAYTCVHAHISR